MVLEQANMGGLVAERIQHSGDIERRGDGRNFVKAVHEELVSLDAQGRKIFRSIYGRKTGPGDKDFEPYFFVHQPQEALYNNQRPEVDIDPKDPTRYIVRSAHKIDVMTTATHVSIDVEKETEVGAVIAVHPDSNITVHKADAVIATHGGKVRLVEKADATLAQGGKIDARTAAIGRGLITTGGEMIVGDALQVSLIGSPKSQATVHFLQDSFVGDLIRGGNTMVTLPMFSRLKNFIGKPIVVEGTQNRISENILDEPVLLRPTGLAGFGDSPLQPQRRTFAQASSYPNDDNDIAIRLFYTELLTPRVEPFWEEYLDGHAHDPQSLGRIGIDLNELYKTDPEKAMAAYRQKVAANDAVEAQIRALAIIEDPDPRQRRMYEALRPRDENFRGVRAPDDPTNAARKKKEQEMRELRGEIAELLGPIPEPFEAAPQPPVYEATDGSTIVWGDRDYPYPPVGSYDVNERREEERRRKARRPLEPFMKAYKFVRRKIREDIELREEAAAAVRYRYEHTEVDRRTLPNFDTTLL